jgi:predicted RNA-binding protein (virulence factor B family)
VTCNQKKKTWETLVKGFIFKSKRIENRFIGLRIQENIIREKETGLADIYYFFFRLGCIRML